MPIGFVNIPDPQSTTAEDWVVNVDVTTPENSSVTFKRPSGPDAKLIWNEAEGRFDFPFPLKIQGSLITTGHLWLEEREVFATSDDLNAIADLTVTSDQINDLITRTDLVASTGSMLVGVNDPAWTAQTILAGYLHEIREYIGNLNALLTTNKDNLVNAINDIAGAVAADLGFNIKPIQSPDGIRVNFNFTDSFTSGAILVFLNGILQDINIEYQELDPNTIRFVAPPQVGDEITAFYRKQI